MRQVPTGWKIVVPKWRAIVQQVVVGVHIRPGSVSATLYPRDRRLREDVAGKPHAGGSTRDVVRRRTDSSA